MLPESWALPHLPARTSSAAGRSRSSGVDERVAIRFREGEGCARCFAGKTLGEPRQIAALADGVPAQQKRTSLADGRELFMVPGFTREEECGARFECAAEQAHARARADSDDFVPLTFAAWNDCRFESTRWEMAAQSLRDLRRCLRFAEVDGTTLTLEGAGMLGKRVHFDRWSLVGMSRTRRRKRRGQSLRAAHHLEAKFWDTLKFPSPTDSRSRRCAAEKCAFHDRCRRALRIGADASSASDRHGAADAFHCIARCKHDDLERLVARQRSGRLQWADQSIADAIDQPIVDAASDRIESGVGREQGNPPQHERCNGSCGCILPDETLDGIENGRVVCHDRVDAQFDRFLRDLLGQVDREKNAFTARIGIPSEKSHIVPVGGQ